MTGEQLPAVPADWWAWWNEYNEVEQVGEKSVAYLQEQRSVAIVDESSPPAAAPAAGWDNVGVFSRGNADLDDFRTRAIEKIRAGDFVLSQNVGDRRTRLQAVLPQPRDQGEDDTVHRWRRDVSSPAAGTSSAVAGKAGERAASCNPAWFALGTAARPRRARLEPGAEAETYNLVVADFSSYFAGNSMILSHDFTQRQPTRTIVPGFKARIARIRWTSSPPQQSCWRQFAAVPIARTYHCPRAQPTRGLSSFRRSTSRAIAADREYGSHPPITSLTSSVSRPKRSEIRSHGWEFRSHG